MRVILYSKKQCPYCDKAKALLKLKNTSFEEVIIGEDIMREDFTATFPEVRTVPFVLIDGEKIGGYDQLAEYFDSGRQFLAG
jgi:alkyl hydroperoxide reductase subunit F